MLPATAQGIVEEFLKRCSNFQIGVLRGIDSLDVLVSSSPSVSVVVFFYSLVLLEFIFYLTHFYYIFSSLVFFCFYRCTLCLPLPLLLIFFLQFHNTVFYFFNYLTFITFFPVSFYFVSSDVLYVFLYLCFNSVFFFYSLIILDFMFYLSHFYRNFFSSLVFHFLFFASSDRT